VVRVALVVGRGHGPGATASEAIARALGILESAEVQAQLEALFDRIAAIAAEGENAGFDTLLVMDHFYQLPALGPPDLYMLEAYTLLGALASHYRWLRRLGSAPAPS